MVWINIIGFELVGGGGGGEGSSCYRGREFGIQGKTVPWGGEGGLETRARGGG